MIKARLNSENGFTLVELVLVMVLVGIITVFISDVIFYEFNMYDRLTNQTDGLQMSRNALRMMSRDIRQIMHPDSISLAYEQSLKFDDVDDVIIYYQFSNNQILRNNDLLQDSVEKFEFKYFDSSGDSLTAPVADPSEIRTISIELGTSLNNNRSISLRTKIRPRNF